MQDDQYEPPMPEDRPKQFYQREVTFTAYHARVQNTVDFNRLLPRALYEYFASDPYAERSQFAASNGVIITWKVGERDGT